MFMAQQTGPTLLFFNVTVPNQVDHSLSASTQRFLCPGKKCGRPLLCGSVSQDLSAAIQHFHFPQKKARTPALPLFEYHPCTTYLPLPNISFLPEKSVDARCCRYLSGSLSHNLSATTKHFLSPRKKRGRPLLHYLMNSTFDSRLFPTSCLSIPGYCHLPLVDDTLRYNLP